MQIYFHRFLCSYLPRVPIILTMTVLVKSDWHVHKMMMMMICLRVYSDGLFLFQPPEISLMNRHTHILITCTEQLQFHNTITLSTVQSK